MFCGVVILVLLLVSFTFSLFFSSGFGGHFSIIPAVVLIGACVQIVRGAVFLSLYTRHKVAVGMWTLDAPYPY